MTKTSSAVPLTYLDRAVADGHATIDTSGTRPRITYVSVNRSEYFDDSAAGYNR